MVFFAFAVVVVVVFYERMSYLTHTSKRWGGKKREGAKSLVSKTIDWYKNMELSVFG